jgi:hypothetical protein
MTDSEEESERDVDDVDSDWDGQDSDEELFAEARTWGEDLMGDEQDRRR